MGAVMMGAMKIVESCVHHDAMMLPVGLSSHVMMLVLNACVMKPVLCAHWHVEYHQKVQSVVLESSELENLSGEGLGIEL